MSMNSGHKAVYYDVLKELSYEQLKTINEITTALLTEQEQNDAKAQLVNMLFGETETAEPFKSIFEKAQTKDNSDDAMLVMMKAVLAGDSKEQADIIRKTQNVAHAQNQPENTTQDIIRKYNEFIRATGLSFEDYIDILSVCDSNKDGIIRKNEIGNYLVALENIKSLTREQANAIWKTMFSGRYADWLKKNK